MIYAYVLVVVNAVGVVSFSPPMATGGDCNVMKQAVLNTSKAVVETQCVRVELARGK